MTPAEKINITVRIEQIDPHLLPARIFEARNTLGKDTTEALPDGVPARRGLLRSLSHEMKRQGLI